MTEAETIETRSDCDAGDARSEAPLKDSPAVTSNDGGKEEIYGKEDTDVGTSSSSPPEVSVTDEELRSIITAILKENEDSITLNEVYPLVDKCLKWAAGTTKNTTAVKDRVKHLAKRLVSDSLKRKREEETTPSHEENGVREKRRKVKNGVTSNTGTSKPKKKTSSDESEKSEKRKTDLRKMAGSLGFGPVIYSGISKEDISKYNDELEDRIKEKCENLEICTGRLPTASEIREYSTKRRQKIELDGLDTKNIVSDSRPRRRAAEAAKLAMQKGGALDKLDDSEDSEGSERSEDSKDGSDRSRHNSENEEPADGSEGEKGRKTGKKKEKQGSSSENDTKGEGEETKKEKGKKESGGGEEEEDDDDDESDFKESSEGESGSSNSDKSDDESESGSDDEDEDAKNSKRKRKTKTSAAKKQKTESGNESGDEAEDSDGQGEDESPKEKEK